MYYCDFPDTPGFNYGEMIDEFRAYLDAITHFSAGSSTTFENTTSGPFAMSDAEYADILEYSQQDQTQQETSDLTQYEVDQQLLCEFPPLTLESNPRNPWKEQRARRGILLEDGVVLNIEDSDNEPQELSAYETAQYMGPGTADDAGATAAQVKAESLYQDEHQVRIKSEPLSDTERAAPTAQISPVRIKNEHVSDDEATEEANVQWEDVLTPMAQHSISNSQNPSGQETSIPVATQPTVAQNSISDSQIRSRQGTASPIPAQSMMPEPWSVPEGRFVYEYPSPPQTEPIDEPEVEVQHHNIFVQPVKEIQNCMILNFTEYPSFGFPAPTVLFSSQFSDFSITDTEMTDVDDSVTSITTDYSHEMEGIEMTDDFGDPMDCSEDFGPPSPRLNPFLPFYVTMQQPQPEQATTWQSTQCRWGESGINNMSPRASISSSFSSSQTRRRLTRAQKRKRAALRTIKELQKCKVTDKTNPKR